MAKGKKNEVIGFCSKCGVDIKRGQGTHFCSNCGSANIIWLEDEDEE